MTSLAQIKWDSGAANFRWDDLFLLDDQLTEDECLIRDAARSYAQDKLLLRETKAHFEEGPIARYSTR